ncbi:MAG: hypothetical protein HY718_12660 [Planctomycetes bacterium]|nr:hypothetical protein [Planctomycetota bacterium]
MLRRSIAVLASVIAPLAVWAGALAADVRPPITNAPAAASPSARSFGRPVTINRGPSIVGGGRSFSASPSVSSRSSRATVVRGNTVSSPNPRAVAAVAPPRTGAPVINGTNNVNRIVTGARTAAGNSSGSRAPVLDNGSAGWGSPVLNTGGTGWGSPVMNNGRAGWGSPIMNNGRAGWASPIFAAQRPASPYGGVAVNRGPGVFINGGPGNPSSASGSQASPPSGYPPPDPNSAWYRRYRATQDYWFGDRHHHDHRWRHHYPVFVWPAAYYVDDVDQLYLNINPPPIFVTGEQQAAVQPPAAAQEDKAVAPKADEQKDAARPEPAEDRQPARERQRTAGRLDPEKLHELMVEGTRLFYDGKYNEAAATFLRVTLADRQNVDATLAYAIARFATGDYQVSALAIRRGVRRIPEVVSSTFDVRSRYGNVDHFRDHLARLEGHLRHHAEDDDAWIVLGFVKHFSGEREVAAEIFRRLKDRPRADRQLADIFLEAKPLPPATQPAGAAASQPAASAANMLPPRSEGLAADPAPLISIEPAP